MKTGKRRPRLANTPGSYFSGLPVYRIVSAAEAKRLCDEAEARRDADRKP